MITLRIRVGLKTRGLSAHMQVLVCLQLLPG